MNMQPIQALDHPSFKKMVDIAAHAMKGIKIPGRKATRKHIIELFKQNLDSLQIKISVNIIQHLQTFFFGNHCFRATTLAL